MVLIFVTSSPAVAERPRDASCLSVASIVQYVESNLLLLVTFASDLPLRTNKFCFFFMSYSSMLVVITKMHGCVALCAINWIVAVVVRTPPLHQSSIDSQLFVKNRDFAYSTFIWRPRNIATRFGNMEQEAQLSQRDRATLRIIEYFVKSLKVTQGHLKWHC